mgnify:CR=1 FL=1
MADGAVTNPSIDRAEHDDTASAKRVTPLSYDSGTLAWVKNGIPKTERYDVQSTTIYVGEAVIGTATNVANWTITKYDLADMTAGSGKVATAATWTNRASETYQ